MKNKNVKNTKETKPEQQQPLEELKKQYKNIQDKMLFKLPDNSIYYGEVAYINEIGNQIKDIEALPEEEQQKCKLVRHGFGCQIFDPTPEGSFSSKYEGEWYKDKRTGKGKIVFSDGDSYVGDFINNLFEGKGKFCWSNSKDSYEGSWSGGKMEGVGCFTHRDGFELKGNYLGNYYINEKNIFVNPFTPKVMIDLFNTKSYEYMKKKQLVENESFSIKNIYKICSKDFNYYFDESYKKNKIPLVLFSEDKDENMDIFLEDLDKLYEEIYIREYFLKLEDSKSNKKKVFEELKSVVVDCMTNGKYFSIYFDDCRVPYNKNFDVNLSVFNGNKMLSNFMWYPITFFQNKCSSNHLEKNPELKLNKNFRFSITSCLTFSVFLEENEIANIIEKRFSSSLPLNRMNVLIIKPNDLE